MTKREFYNTFEPPRFSRDWWLSRLRNTLWIAMVTVLVWIYADVEFTDEMDLTATVLLGTAKSPNLVLLSENRVRAIFKVQGRRGSLERLEQRLNAPDAAIRYQVGEHDDNLSTRDIINTDPFIQAEGLTVLSASPSVLRVRLDTKTHQPDIPVKFEYTGAFPSEVTIDPPKMGLHVARHQWQEVLKANPKPTLRTVSVELKSVDSGKPLTVPIIRRIGEVPVEPDQPTVTVKVKIAQLTETQEVTVPVQILCPASWVEPTTGVWKDYVLTRQSPHEWRVKIPLSGTRKDLDQLKTGDVQAYVVLTDDDKKPVSWLTRPVEVRLPRELNLSRLGPLPSVTFKLEKVAPKPIP